MRGKDDALLTKNLTVGESVYNEKRVSVDVSSSRFEIFHMLIKNVSKPHVYRTKKLTIRLSTECGTLSDQSWLPLLLEVSRIST